MADVPSTAYVTLVSNDGYEFKLVRSAACIAGTIKKALDPMSGFRENTENRVDLPTINGVVLEKVCEYLLYNERHKESRDVADMDIPPELCLELLIAADYLDDAAHENLPVPKIGTLVSCIGSLSTPEGQKYQEAAYQEIVNGYSEVKEAWATDFEKEKVPYMNAIAKEVERYYTVRNMSLPRKIISDAGNHNVDYWRPDAGSFNPERRLDPLILAQPLPANGSMRLLDLPYHIIVQD
ncbi:elongin C [Pleosporales sp. CAS-2024a]